MKPIKEIQEAFDFIESSYPKGSKKWISAVNTIKEHIETFTRLDKELEDVGFVLNYCLDYNTLIKTKIYPKYQSFVCSRCKLHTDSGCKDGDVKDEQCLYNHWKEYLLREEEQ